MTVSASPRRAPLRSRRASRIALTALAAVVAAVFFAPLWWTIITSLRPSSEVFRYLDPIQWKTFFTTTPTIENYATLLYSDLGRALANSLLVTAVTVVVGILICAMAAFALSAVPFRGRGAVYVVVLIAFLIPFDAIAIPLADIFRGWGLANTFVGLILPGLGNGMAILILRTFFLAIPPELVEAARLDGLGWWGIFSRLYLPLSAPALIGAGLTLFLFQWQSYVWPLLMGTDPHHMLAPIALANLQGQHSVDYGVLFAGAIVLTLVPLVLILFFQRQFAQSANTSGID